MWPKGKLRDSSMRSIQLLLLRYRNPYARTTERSIAEGSPQLTASKEMRISDLQPKGT